MRSYKQSFTNSCGAVSLLCAAAELGVKDIGPSRAGQDPEELIVSPLCESLLYERMGEANSSVRFAQSPSESSSDRMARLNNFGYIMPSKLAAQARALGLKVKFYMPPSFMASAIEMLYSKAKADVIEAGFEIIQSDPPTLRGDERAIRIVIVNALHALPVGLHYIMQRPDGTHMDPATGNNTESYEACSADGGWLQDYTLLGITIVVGS